jgi:hypothetical protein
MSKYKSKIKRKKYALAGMYEPNEVPSGIGAGSTGNIVMEENNPELQAQRETALEAEKQRLIQQSETTAAEFKEQDQIDKTERQANANNLKNRFDLGEQDLSKGLQLGSKELGFTAGKNMLSEGTKFAGSKIGTKFLGTEFAKKQLAKQATKEAAKGIVTEGAGQVGATAAKTASTAAKINPYGIASIAGKGVSMLSDDKDATKWNAGEVIGDVASAAGTGAQIGSMLLPGIGTAIGGIAGGLYGIGKGLFGRKKARTEEANQASEKKSRLFNYNAKASDKFKSSWAAAAAGRHKSKTYSGSDIGRKLPGIG